ncbi:MAG: formyltransferase family protein [Gammaproteobacteria bacterium]|nr:formyltransferase family protein [Gammaproteobacteria bacterium]
MAGPFPPLVLFATNGRFSAAVLEGLIGGGLIPRVLVLPGQAGTFYEQPACAAGSTAELARRRGIPLIHLPPHAPESAVERVSELRPVLGIMACFPRPLPMAVADLPPWGTLNIHPSRLPLYRGPAPLFWQLRDGVERLHVSLHRVVPELDAGDVVARETGPLPMGAGGAALDRRLVALGVTGLLGLLAAHPDGAFSDERQDPAAATRQPWPAPPDFAVDASRSARRAYTFMTGCGDWRQPFRVRGAGDLLLSRAVSFRDTGALGMPWRPAGDTVLVQCAPGILRAVPEPPRAGAR